MSETESETPDFGEEEEIGTPTPQAVPAPEPPPDDDTEDDVETTDE